MKTGKLIAAAGMVMVAGMTTASAAITSVTGSTNWLTTPPVSCVPFALNGPVAFTWDEQQNVTTSGQYCDMVNNPGSSGGAIAGVISGMFDSHFISYQDYSGLPPAVGTVTFNAPIVGVIFVGTTLDGTDVQWGAGGTTYPTLYPFRGLNFSSSFSILGNTISFNLSTISPVIEVVQIRVLTAPIPTPGPMALLGLGGLVACRRRRND